jgi:hypothetical protein
VNHHHSYIMLSITHNHFRGDETHYHEFEKGYAMCYWEDGTDLFIEQLLPSKDI